MKREREVRRADVWINMTPPARPLSHAGRDAGPAARSYFMKAWDKRNIRLGRHSSLRVNLAALIPYLCPCWPYFHLARKTGIARALQPPPLLEVSSLIYRCGRRLETARHQVNESPAVRVTQLDPQTPAHIPGAASPSSLHHPTAPTHCLAPSFQCAKVWHSVKKMSQSEGGCGKRQSRPERSSEPSSSPSTPTLHWATGLWCHRLCVSKLRSQQLSLRIYFFFSATTTFIISFLFLLLLFFPFPIQQLMRWQALTLW